MKPVVALVKHWKVKWALQRIMAATPWPSQLNYLFQRYVTRGVVWNERRFEARLDRIKEHLEAMRVHGPEAETGFPALEVGTGWVPAVSIGLALGGASRVTTVDIEDHVRPRSVAMVLGWFQRYARSGRLMDWLGPPAADASERIDRALSLAIEGQAEEALATLGIERRSGDLRHVESIPGGYALIVSALTLEHVPTRDIPALFDALHRLSAPNGVMSHLIDYGDHYSYFDRRLSPYHFFAFSDEEWSRWDSPLGHQNRLLAPDFQRLFEDAKFEVVRRVDDRPMAQRLSEVQLSERFRGYSTSDLEVTSSWFTVRPVRHAGDAEWD